VIIIKTEAEIEKIHKAGIEVHRILELLKSKSHTGVNLLELDKICKKEIEDIGAESSYIDYEPKGFGKGPFRHYVCLSVNDAVLHGKPYDYRLKRGDLLSIDLAFSIDEFVADAAISFIIDADGTKEEKLLISSTKEALNVAIDKCQVGNTIGDISAAIGLVAKKYKIPVNTEFGGHGVGEQMHEDPHIPNTGKFKTGAKLIEGMVLAIEPWWFKTTKKLVTDKDGWTLRSSDGSRGAHAEHTVAITKSGPIVLTNGK
jgi:methionyl aminopeptidase